jgi:hypothetical protein
MRQLNASIRIISKSRGCAKECPKHIEEILLQILSRALLSIRSYGFSNADSKRSGIEADHVHNLPGLVKSFSYSELRLYLDAFAPEYVRLVGEGGEA